MECPLCGHAVPDDAATCPRCTATLRFVAETPPRAEGPREPLDHARALAELDRARRPPGWRPWVDAAVTGALAWAGTDIAAALPASFAPGRLLDILVASLLLGAPMGALVRRVRGGPVLGGLLSVLFFIGQRSLFPSMFCGGWLGSVTNLWVVMAVLPGVLVGTHLQLSRT
ncbi:MAG: zinc ribbon domain-containing protein [Deltaproteobacteria bacterium]|nr:zinc ribbon domain-containing protein [Deltaproteobacteria bacterium]